MDWIKDFEGWRVYLDNGNFEARDKGDPLHVLTDQTLEGIEQKISDAVAIRESQSRLKKSIPMDYDMEDFWAAGW